MSVDVEFHSSCSVHMSHIHSLQSEYFNTWAFVFVGLYGYPFLDSGKNVINLFRTRGWTTIITDTLAQGVLGMLSAAVGLITGLVALVIAHGKGMVFGDELGASAAAFFIGFVIGMVLTSTLMTLVSSAVNTVIVCYAEAPMEFQQNHLRHLVTLPN